MQYDNKENSESIVLGSTGRRGANFARLRRFQLDQLEDTKKFDGYDSGNLFPIYLAHH